MIARHAVNSIRIKAAETKRSAQVFEAKLVVFKISLVGEITDHDIGINWIFRYRFNDLTNYALKWPSGGDRGDRSRKLAVLQIHVAGLQPILAEVNVPYLKDP